MFSCNWPSYPPLIRLAQVSKAEPMGHCCSRLLQARRSPRHSTESKHQRKQDCPALLKAKYCPRVAAVVNPGELVQAVSCTQETHKNPRDLDLWSMTLILSRLLEVVEVHVRAKFHQAKCSGSWVIMLTSFDDAGNNTDVTSTGSKTFDNNNSH